MKEDFIKMVQENHKNQKYMESLERSVNNESIEYEKKKSIKDKNFKKRATLAIVVLALTTTMSIPLASAKVSDIKKTNEQRSAILTETGQVVNNNTQTYEWNSEAGEKYWNYQMWTMAEEVLTTNQEYDINTRIYGCINNLLQYNKDYYIDDLFNKMSSLITANPSAYNENDIYIANYKTFNEYLEALGLSQDEWNKLMKDVITAYAKSNNESSELESLLSGLNVSNGGR